MKRVVLFLLIILFSTIAFSETDQLKKIEKAIEEKGANWKASENWVTRLSKEEQKKLCNYKREIPKLQKGDLLQLEMVEDLPSEFDWRDVSGVNWDTSVKNQSPAGSCWAFSTTGQLESWWKIENSMPDSAIDLSEQFLISCNPNATANDGYWVSKTLDFIVSYGGIAHETCFPYEGTDVDSSECCADWQTNAVTIPDWGYITSNIADVETIKNAVYRHPVSASYTVYNDFYSYSGGVYEQTSDVLEGGHAVLIVGWIDSLECWIVKNSWGPYWGENGYFKIKWGECEFGEYSEFVYNNKIDGAVFSSSDYVIDVSISVGNSTTKTVTYTNSSNSIELEYASTIVYDSNKLIEFDEEHFHTDDYNAYDGKSWWCGDSTINGYNNHWLDYLETPVIDLSGTTSPALSFKGYWAVESTGGEDPPYDGWDGCNVWISTNGGEIFSVITPTSPVYDCGHLWSFGHPGQGFGMGTDIAGWAGSSGGWKNVNFDLSSYISDSVVVRFALASDLAECVTDDYYLKGFFIDNVDISDETNTIFSDDCGDSTNMTAIGMTSGDHDWLTITKGAGKISQNSSEQVTFNINAEDLNSGEYSAEILIQTNDNTNRTITINLKVTNNSSNVNSVEVVDNYKLNQNYPNPFNPITNINYSINSNNSENVKLIIFDLMGKKMEVLVDEMQSNGNYEVKFDGSDYSSGIYFYRLMIGNEFSDTKKMVFLK